MEALFKVKELRPVTLEHAGDRDAGPPGHDLSDIFRVHLFFEHLALRLHFLKSSRGFADPFFEIRDHAVAELCHAPEIPVTFLPLGLRLR